MKKKNDNPFVLPSIKLEIPEDEDIIDLGYNIFIKHSHPNNANIKDEINEMIENEKKIIRFSDKKLNQIKDQKNLDSLLSKSQISTLNTLIDNLDYIIYLYGKNYNLEIIKSTGDYNLWYGKLEDDVYHDDKTEDILGKQIFFIYRTEKSIDLGDGIMLREISPRDKLIKWEIEDMIEEELAIGFSDEEIEKVETPFGSDISKLLSNDKIRILSNKLNSIAFARVYLYGENKFGVFDWNRPDEEYLIKNTKLTPNYFGDDTENDIGSNVELFIIYKVQIKTTNLGKGYFLREVFPDDILLSDEVKNMYTEKGIIEGFSNEQLSIVKESKNLNSLLDEDQITKVKSKVNYIYSNLILYGSYQFLELQFFGSESTPISPFLDTNKLDDYKENENNTSWQYWILYKKTFSKTTYIGNNYFLREITSSNKLLSDEVSDLIKEELNKGKIINEISEDDLLSVNELKNLNQIMSEENILKIKDIINATSSNLILYNSNSFLELQYFNSNEFELVTKLNETKLSDYKESENSEGWKYWILYSVSNYDSRIHISSDLKEYKGWKFISIAGSEKITVSEYKSKIVPFLAKDIILYRFDFESNKYINLSDDYLLDPKKGYFINYL